MIPKERAHLHVAAKSHPGMSGKDNEDRYAVSAFHLSEKEPTPVVFAVVADGVGGHRAGEVAAEVAVETISKDVAESDASHPIQTLQEAVVHASQSILSLSDEDPEKAGMGATCACVWVIGDRLYISYVGDSRIYLIRGNTIQQITIDHTWVQEAIDAGVLAQDQARNHPNAHVIRRYLGSRQTVEPDFRLRISNDESDEQSTANQGFKLTPGSHLVICSDGLTDLVDNHEILSTLKSMEQVQALDSLINLANQRGGHDNITIVSLMVPDTISQSKPVPEPVLTKRPIYKRPSCLVGVFILLLLLTIISVGGFLYWQNTGSNLSPTPTFTQEVTQPVISPSDKPAIDITKPIDTATILPTLEEATVPPTAITPTYTAWPNTVYPMATP